MINWFKKLFNNNMDKRQDYRFLCKTSKEQKEYLSRRQNLLFPEPDEL